MVLNALIRWLKPREMVFFELLEASASNLVDASRTFAEGLASSNPAQLQAMRRQIKDLEHKGDEITHELLDRLDHSFVTPIEREDILALAHALDDVADCLDAAAERIALYKIQSILPAAVEMGRLLVAGTEETLPLIQSLRNMSDVKRIRMRIMEVSDLENRSDALYHSALEELFTDAKDPIYLIKWKEIFGQMEDAMDRIQLVSKVVGSTVMRNA